MANFGPGWPFFKDYVYFLGGNCLQIFWSHHSQHDRFDEGRFVVPQYFHCYHAGIRVGCILHLQYGFRYVPRGWIKKSSLPFIPILSLSFDSFVICDKVFFFFLKLTLK